MQLNKYYPLFLILLLNSAALIAMKKDPSNESKNCVFRIYPESKKDNNTFDSKDQKLNELFPSVIWNHHYLECSSGFMGQWAAESQLNRLLQDFALRYCNKKMVIYAEGNTAGLFLHTLVSYTACKQYSPHTAPIIVGLKRALKTIILKDPKLSPDWSPLTALKNFDDDIKVIIYDTTAKESEDAVCCYAAARERTSNISDMVPSIDTARALSYYVENDDALIKALAHEKKSLKGTIQPVTAEGIKNSVLTGRLAQERNATWWRKVRNCFFGGLILFCIIAYRWR